MKCRTCWRWCSVGRITVPDRAERHPRDASELFRTNSHLLHIRPFVQDVGAMTPVFFGLTDLAENL